MDLLGAFEPILRWESRASDGHIPLPRVQIPEAASDHGHVFERQGPHRHTQEGDTLLARFDQGEHALRRSQSEGETRGAAAGPDVEPALAGQGVGSEDERVSQVDIREAFSGLCPREIDSLVPYPNEFEQRSAALLERLGRRNGRKRVSNPLDDGCPTGWRGFQGHGRVGSTSPASLAVVLGA